MAVEGLSGLPAASKLANKINLDVHLDEQREREYEALVTLSGR